MELANLFKLPFLETICRNILTDNENLNPSIAHYVNNETGKKLKEMFLNNQKLSDVMLRVEGNAKYKQDIL